MEMRSKTINTELNSKCICITGVGKIWKIEKKTEE